MIDQGEFYSGAYDDDPDPRFAFVADTVSEYHESCEAYNKTVCTRRHRNIAMPETMEQWHLINRNAKQKKEELLCFAVGVLEISRGDAEVYWDKAMITWRPNDGN